MFRDQKLYLQLHHLILDIICLAVVYFILMPFMVLLVDSKISGGLFENGLNVYGSVYFLLAPVFVFSPLVLLKKKSSNAKIWYPLKKSRLIAIILITVVCWQVLCFGFELSLIRNTGYTAVFLFMLCGLLILNRYYLEHTIANSSTSRYLIRHVLIAGTGQAAQKFAEYIKTHPETGLRVAGFLSEKSRHVGRAFCGTTVWGKMDVAADVIAEHYIDCVVNPGEIRSERIYGNLYMACATRGVDFITSDVLSEGVFYNVMQVSKEALGDIDFTIFNFVYRDPVQVFIKRKCDFVLSFILIVASLPLWAAIAVSIKLTSKGPVFFRQMRVGKYGRPFMLYKFRSMVNGAENMQKDLAKYNEMDGPAFKIKHDPRQTLTGKFLRRTSLDELPQLLNVFKGDISLVGPRPALQSEVAMYRPWERKRLSVSQGITCVWQVSGRNTIKFDEWMKLDLMYIENWSLASDYKILLRTIPAVLLKKGAY